MESLGIIFNKGDGANLQCVGLGHTGMLCLVLHQTCKGQKGQHETREGLHCRVIEIVTANELQGQVSILRLPRGQGHQDLSQDWSRE